MKAGVGMILAALVLTAAGCGDEEPTELETREEIAMTINEVRDGLEAGDGEAVCSRLTEQGQETMVRLAREQRRVAGESCEEVVASIATELSDKELRVAIGRADYSAADVDVDPTDDDGFSGVTDEVPEGGVPSSVEVRCKRGDGNSYFAVREGDEWKLMVPFCSGR